LKDYELDVTTEKEQANTLDFQKLFQFNLPPEALDLKDFVDGFKDKDLGMEYNKENSIKNAL
jgi:hypothetical protein